MTRTVFVGKPKEELVKIYNTVLTAQKAALEGAVKGLTGKKIDAVAREIIYREGFGFNFGHGLDTVWALKSMKNPDFHRWEMW